MIPILTVPCIWALRLLTLVTVVQMLYMDSLRLRTKEYPMLQVFRDEMEERIGLKAEAGVLSFSLIKHSLLALLGTLMLLLAAMGEAVSIIPFIEAAVAAWATMMLFAYILPQYLYRGTPANGSCSCSAASRAGPHRKATDGVARVSAILVRAR